jgi:site-specific DNA-methyltransferase (adenine-specific)
MTNAACKEYDPADDGAKSYLAAIEAKRLRGDTYYPEPAPWKRVVTIGNATLYLGDAREILPHVPAYDRLVSDPPCGISLVPQRAITKAIANDGRDDAQALWRAVVNEVYPRLPDDSAHILWTGWSETWTKDLLAEWFTIKSCIVWAKNVWGIGYYTRPQHEFAWYCHKGKPPLPPVPDSDLWSIPKVQAPVHSCEKPVELLSRCIRLVGGSVILDPFMGVGTTGVAAIKAGKGFVGVELDPHYFEAACRRIQDAVDRPDLFISQRDPEPVQQPLFGEGEAA